MRFVVTLLFLVSPFVTCIVNNTKLLIGTKISLQYESLKETLRHRLQYSFNESHHDEATFDYKRIKYNPQLSAKTFYDLYEVTSTPVVIETPNISYWSSNHHQQWNAAFFKKHCGNALARIRIGHSISAPILEWELYYVNLYLLTVLLQYNTLIFFRVFYLLKPYIYIPVITGILIPTRYHGTTACTTVGINNNNLYTSIPVYIEATLYYFEYVSL